MEQHKTPLTDSLVKAAAWTHNTSVNKLGYSPLQLVTGQAVMVPGLTTSNVATESMTDSEAVRRTMENLMRITSEFRELDMRKKLKDCQNLRVRDYQHRRNYVEGDKVWFQPLNGNAWIGPALVVTQRGQSVYLHTHGDLKKITACRVKLFELVNTNEDESKEIMKEDGLEDIDNFYITSLDTSSLVLTNSNGLTLHAATFLRSPCVCK